MTPEEEEALVEAVSTAWRPRGVDGTLRAHPAWHDLDAEGRTRAYEEARATRVIEAALDPEGYSTTVHAVLSRIAASRATLEE
jgi:hypothetical protein